MFFFICLFRYNIYVCTPSIRFGAWSFRLERNIMYNNVHDRKCKGRERGMVNWSFAQHKLIHTIQHGNSFPNKCIISSSAQPYLFFHHESHRIRAPISYCVHHLYHHSTQLFLFHPEHSFLISHPATHLKLIQYPQHLPPHLPKLKHTHPVPQHQVLPLI
ncbi:hypothetical protein T440DRAFT_300515 [Plenodomus tracheiphilus IPT5]|uniref:Uncharacterized protein n=1 Tax=Plenodomus tracheiphilus IPT5 TaxID=1408161 RepID=A0A6A7ANP0_9PLEO|nr:hypothetical protein T440DRAFT_300515 [Plenodomus tracheiphilus IPT5]